MKKTNNKGFSLVELIIVIAIMAVLVGVLAPAYMRYVENARKSRDISAMDSVLNTVEASLIDATVRSDDAFTVIIHVNSTDTGSGAYTGVANTGNTNAVWFEIDPAVAGSMSAAETALGAELYDVLGVYELAGDWQIGGTDISQDIEATVNGNNVEFSTTAISGGATVESMAAYSADLADRVTIN